MPQFLTIASDFFTFDLETLFFFLKILTSMEAAPTRLAHAAHTGRPPSRRRPAFSRRRSQ
jgi:hypothetical protein